MQLFWNKANTLTCNPISEIMTIGRNITRDMGTLQAVSVAGMLGHSISILLTTYAHFIPTMQDHAAHVMDEILTPIPIKLPS